MRSMRWMQKGRHARVAEIVRHPVALPERHWRAYGEDLTVIVQVDVPAVVVWTVFRVIQMLKRCPNCGADRLAPQTTTRKRHVAGHVFTADLPGRLCAKCRTSYFDDLVVGQFDALVAAKLAEAAVTQPEALKFMRKVTGLQGKEFAELLAVRPETVSRWEQGRRPIDRATYAVIRQLVYDVPAASRRRPTISVRSTGRNDCPRPSRSHCPAPPRA